MITKTYHEEGSKWVRCFKIPNSNWKSWSKVECVY